MKQKDVLQDMYSIIARNQREPAAQILTDSRIMFITKLYLSRNVYSLKGAAPNSAAFEIVFGLIRGIGI